MLGFDVYTKSTIGTIIKQRVSLFLVKRGVINYPILLKQANSKQARTTIAEQFFEKFVVELSKQQIYEEYAFASIFIEDPDYDFLSNDAATSIRKARKSLKQQFIKISKAYFDKIAGKEEKEKESAVPSAADDDVFGFLAEAQNQREIPKYAENYNLFYATGPTGIVSQYRSFKSAFLVPTDKKGINTIKSPFYVEYFYRLKPSFNPTLPGANRGYYNYLSKKDKIVATAVHPSAKAGPEGSAALFSPNGDPLLEFDKNFDRGIRLMFNLSAGVAVKKDDSGYVYLEPTDALPFFKGDKNIYADLYPLLFLSAFSLSEFAGFSLGKNNLGKRDASSGYFLSALWLTLQAEGFAPEKKKGYLEGNFNNKYSPGIKDGKSIISYKPNFYTLLASQYWPSIYPKGTKPQVPTPTSGPKFWPPALQWSKSLVSLEIEKENNKKLDPCYAYFPMIVGEFVDTTGMMKDQDPQLLEELLKTDTVEYLKGLVPKTLNQATPPTEKLKKQLFTNEDNLNALSLAEPTLGNPFNTKEEEKGLDNMLINLINFDEE